MIMREHESISRMTNGRFEDFARVSQGFVESPDRDLHLFNQAKARIDQCNGKDFAIGLDQFTGKEAINPIGAIQGFFGDLITTAKGAEAKSAEEADGLFLAQDSGKLNKRSP